MIIEGNIVCDSLNYPFLIVGGNRKSMVDLVSDAELIDVKKLSIKVEPENKPLILIRASKLFTIKRATKFLKDNNGKFVKITVEEYEK
ncbi:MAG: hypothetical protein ACXAAH_17395 [Promethearchaeota archaeon]